MLKVIFALLLVSSSALAFEGTYSGNGHFADIKFSSRGGDDFLVTSCGYYGNFCTPITAAGALAEGQTKTTAEGSMDVWYGNYKCTYPTSFTFSFDGDSLYVTQYAPSNFPAVRYGYCPSNEAVRYVNYVEQAAYVKQPQP